MSSYQRKDKFYQKAKAEGYVSRSAYKLIELDKRFGILKPGRKIIDLGCAPGGWLQMGEEKMRGSWIADRGSQIKDCELRLANNEQRTAISDQRSSSIIGIDLLPLAYQPGEVVQFIQGDFLDPVNQKKIIEALGRPADWILSDMSPNLSGVKFRDTLASTELCEGALEFAKKVLKKGGGLVVKIFPGPDFEPFKKKVQMSFEKVSTFIPESTRKSSTEVYLVATGFR